MGVRDNNLSLRLSQQHHPSTSRGEWLHTLRSICACNTQLTSRVLTTAARLCPPSLPPLQLVDRLASTVLGVNSTFRQSAFTSLFNPTNTTPPFFQVFSPDFLDVLGPAATLRAIATNPDFAFAHEAPVWVPETDEVHFASLDGAPLGRSDVDHNNQVSKISLGEVARAIDAAPSGVSAVNVSFTKVCTMYVLCPCPSFSHSRSGVGAAQCTC